MSPRVQAVLDLVSEMTEDERVELRGELDGSPATAGGSWGAAWSGDLSRRMGQIERGEVKLLTEEEFFANDDE